jgi:hypothetical protein
MLDFLDNPACLDVCGKLWKGLRFKLREARYTHCVILAGTNDVGGCKGSAEDIFKNIDKLAKVAKDFGCETFVMTIPELREEKNHRNMENIRISANRLLMQSQSLSTIDLSTVVPYHRLPRTDRDRMWEPDGLHLRPAGYSKIAHAVALRLRQGARLNIVASGGEYTLCTPLCTRTQTRTRATQQNAFCPWSVSTLGWCAP